MKADGMLFVRDATVEDVPEIARLIRALADYERLTDLLELDVTTLSDHLFGDRRFAEVMIAEWDGQAVGFALFFHNYSTFLGRPGIYLEDLFVESAYRGRGIGKSLLARVARAAVERGCGRLEWTVLDWNTPALAFYQRLGAKAHDEWRLHRLTGASLRALAFGSTP